MRIIEAVTFTAERNDVIGIFGATDSGYLLATLTEWSLFDRIPIEFQWTDGVAPEYIVDFARNLIEISTKGKAWSRTWDVGGCKISLLRQRNKIGIEVERYDEQITTFSFTKRDVESDLKRQIGEWLLKCVNTAWDMA